MRRVVAAIAALSLLLATAAPVLGARGPSNDTVRKATAVTRDVPIVQDTSSATSARTDVHECAPSGHTVWFKFTATENEELSANTFGSDYDTTLHVLHGSDIIACNDDAGGLESLVFFEVVAGQTYHFQVGSYGEGPGGSLTFVVGDAPPPLELGITIDPNGTLDTAANAVLVSGSVSCSADTFVYLYGELVQRAGRQLIRGGFEEFVDCSSSAPQPWAVWVTGFTGIYNSGPADVTAVAFACRGTCVEVEATRRISIKK